MKNLAILAQLQTISHTITKKGEQQTTTLPFIIKLIPFINNQDSAPNHSN